MCWLSCTLLLYCCVLGRWFLGSLLTNSLGHLIHPQQESCCSIARSKLNITEFDVQEHYYFHAKLVGEVVRSVLKPLISEDLVRNFVTRSYLNEILHNNFWAYCSTFTHTRQGFRSTPVCFFPVQQFRVKVDRLW